MIEHVLDCTEDPVMAGTNMVAKFWMTICDLLLMPVLSPPTVNPCTWRAGVL